MEMLRPARRARITSHIGKPRAAGLIPAVHASDFPWGSTPRLACRCLFTLQTDDSRKAACMPMLLREMGMARSHFFTMPPRRVSLSFVFPLRRITLPSVGPFIPPCHNEMNVTTSLVLRRDFRIYPALFNSIVPNHLTTDERPLRFALHISCSIHVETHSWDAEPRSVSILENAKEVRLVRLLSDASHVFVVLESLKNSLQVLIGLVLPLPLSHNRVPIPKTNESKRFQHRVPLSWVPCPRCFAMRAWQTLIA